MYAKLSNFIRHPLFYRYLIVFLIFVSAFIYIFQLFSGILFPFFTGLFFAYLFNPIVSFLKEKKIPRGLSSILIVFFLLIFISFFVSSIIPILKKELFHWIEDIPFIIKETEKIITLISKKINRFFTENEIANFKSHFTNQLNSFMKWCSNFILSILSQGFVFANVLSIIILTPIVMYYSLKDFPNITKHVQKLLPPSYKKNILDFLDSLHTAFMSYIKGQFLICFFLFLLYSFFLYVNNIPCSILIGFIVGVLSFAPYVGGIFGLFLSLILLLQHDQGLFLFYKTLIIFFSLSILEGKFLIPRFIGRKIGIHPVWILFTLLAGANIMGFVGVFFSIPIIVFVRTAIVFLNKK